MDFTIQRLSLHFFSLFHYISISLCPHQMLNLYLFSIAPSLFSLQFSFYCVSFFISFFPSFNTLGSLSSENPRPPFYLSYFLLFQFSSSLFRILSHLFSISHDLFSLSPSLSFPISFSTNSRFVFFLHFFITLLFPFFAIIFLIFFC